MMNRKKLSCRRKITKKDGKEDEEVEKVLQQIKKMNND